MVTIRLARGGSKKHPFYHIIVTDIRHPRDGRYIERLGYYNPMPAGNDVPLKIAEERTEYWISKGAQLSKRVETLYKKLKNTGRITKSSNQESVAALS